jgi:predicted DNA-binding transcriptional regulator AlpA
MKWLSYTDLEAMKIFGSRMSLKRAIDNLGFPAGTLVTPNRRRWREDEVEAWIAARPSSRKPSPRVSASCSEAA